MWHSSGSSMANVLPRAKELCAGGAHAQHTGDARGVWLNASGGDAYEALERHALESALRRQQSRHAARRARRTKAAMQLAAQQEEQHQGASSRHRHDGLREHTSAVEVQELALLQKISARQGMKVNRLCDSFARFNAHATYGRLQLILAAEAQDPAQEPDQERENEDRLAVALAALNKVLARDRKCVEVCYAAGSQVHDVLHDLVDDEDYDRWRQQQGAANTAAEEILSFSTLKAGITCRIACIRFVDDTYAFRSSAYIRELASQANAALLEKGEPVGTLIEFIWNSLVSDK
ncbi:hypothetical protein FI667_g1882, partial [Globisporangium splendens]